ncbi:SDR family NAD(P)-dependent oxidoreductase [Pseudomonas sp. N040]|uniref:SDR family NAD(P)-dependent oxidoreductase n=1 Tax=Pseudomonas sp. N040 TaxID=2785325 RepID=UPI0018A2C292|nr:SDR family NAD(P)-dependent oxidoreductase [Pseudomonas sp. N040]MBF7729976.1 SDR family NAD(P)-dependent oxidoreductase [Pseudomonas sp. N040]MBW7013618.1 SDR family NAD(P)-dependent oxidoreductase [Pseudomonas sp. N040]
MHDFANKTVYITGAASGMGLLTAKRLAGLGAHIVCFERSPNDAALAEIQAACLTPTQQVRRYQLDVANRDQVLAVIAQAAVQAGSPDLLVHMAGIGGVAEFVDMPFEQFDQMLQINLYGTRHVCEAVLPLMLQRGHGHLLLVGSMGGIVPVYGYTAYGTSKFAVVGFAQSLRYELKPRGIQVQCFCPGEVATPALAAEREATHPATRALKLIGGTLTTDQAIDGLLAGLQRGEFFITPGWKTRLVHWAVRLTPPALWQLITDGIVSRALRQSRNNPA